MIICNPLQIVSFRIKVYKTSVLSRPHFLYYEICYMKTFLSNFKKNVAVIFFILWLLASYLGHFNKYPYKCLYLFDNC